MSLRIDAMGKGCPIPVIMAKKEIDSGNADFIMEVDNAIATENLARLGESMSFATVVTGGEGRFEVSFTKGEGGAITPEKPPESAPKTGNWSVFVGSDIIGSGDPELGRSLMRMYFYTLAQGDKLPSSVLFMNAGVKLPAEDPQVVEHLKAFADRGTVILVCGTCLNFYGIADKLQVGTVSNMYDITRYMSLADKVITL